MHHFLVFFSSKNKQKNHPPPFFFESFTVRTDPEAHVVHVSMLSFLFTDPLAGCAAEVVDLGGGHMMNGFELQPRTRE